MFLIDEEMQAINELVDYGQENYTWKSPEVTEYTTKLNDMMRSLHRRLVRAQANLVELRTRLDAWALVPVLVRKDRKANQLLAVGERYETFEKRYRVIVEGAEELERVLEMNYKLYFDLMVEELEEPPGESLRGLKVVYHYVKFVHMR